ncbi:hypothetical protein AV939_12240 [Alteromonas sp. Mac1]|nr:hypothetical protein AV939_12240 [Alteromonas sp. Mac1]
MIPLINLIKTRSRSSKLFSPAEFPKAFTDEGKKPRDNPPAVNETDLFKKILLCITITFIFLNNLIT